MTLTGVGCTFLNDYVTANNLHILNVPDNRKLFYIDLTIMHKVIVLMASV